MTNNQPRTVALLFPPRVSHLERAARGIVDYATRHGGWKFVVWTERFGVGIGSLVGWKGDGAILLIDTEGDALTVEQLHIPVVNISGVMPDAGFPRVLIDNHAVGIAAAEHLLERGFRRFAYYGISDLWYSQCRCEAFRCHVEDAGMEFQDFTVGGIVDQRPWHHDEDELCAWLETLKPPVGLMACSDHRARMVADACKRVGLEVPNDVAIIGVDDERIICELGEPTLTSIARNNLKIGYEAAALLDHLMAGEAPDCTDVMVKPEGVVPRQSTDIVCADDIHLAAAIRYIRANIGKPFDVKQLVARIPVSRRYVENGFKRLWSITPRQYIVNLRIDRAKQMLAGTEREKIENVAKACGFNNPLQFRRVFKSNTGLSPREYRRRETAGRLGRRAT
ncbi:MAG: DNA-binding transcriptional regulator [Pirellulales bacterium]|nr:DNA-binding transcriptional regulator [Pirellulales bacterium]